jgi:hypothetical protein
MDKQTSSNNLKMTTSSTTGERARNVLDSCSLLNRKSALCEWFFPFLSASSADDVIPRHRTACGSRVCYQCVGICTARLEIFSHKHVNILSPMTSFRNAQCSHDDWKPVPHSLNACDYTKDRKTRSWTLLSKSDTHKPNSFFAELKSYQKLMNSIPKEIPQSDIRSPRSLRLLERRNAMRSVYMSIGTRLWQITASVGLIKVQVFPSSAQRFIQSLDPLILIATSKLRLPV